MPYLPQSLAFDFDAPAAPVPFAPRSHTSYLSALTIAGSGRRGRKTRAYLRELLEAGDEGLSDQEAARAIARRLQLRGLPVQSICSIRGTVTEVSLLEKAGTVLGDWGKQVQRWRLNAAGLAAARAMGVEP